MKHRVEVHHGHVVDELFGDIESYKPQLAVICIHGWSGPKYLVPGSVVERMVRLSPAPVLTIRATGG